MCAHVLTDARSIFPLLVHAQPGEHGRGLAMGGGGVGCGDEPGEGVPLQAEEGGEEGMYV